MKLDQLLRAHDLGETRSDAIDAISLRARPCRSRSTATYDIRKKYHKLYYHFKPGKVYWMIIILVRKFGISLFALLFRRNVSFMLSCCLLLLFACYVLQVRHRPYMSSVEKEAVKENHRLKAHDAELMLHEASMDEISKESRNGFISAVPLGSAVCMHPPTRYGMHACTHAPMRARLSAFLSARRS